MVRINLISPNKLADQHLIAEYNEMLMLLGYVKKFPSLDGIPKEYCLGKGHIKFFKNKLVYLRERHSEIIKEMRRRGFAVNRRINLRKFRKELCNNWKPSARDFEIIKERLKWKIEKKPEFYRYYGEKRGKKFLIGLLD
jgi:deoxyribonuclease (pyrimidine dimer)